MTLTVATGVTGPLEAELVRTVEQGQADAIVTRRCADAVELVSAIESGLARVAVVDRQLPGLTRDAVDRLASAGAVSIELRPPGSQSAALGATLTAESVAAVVDLLPAIAGSARRGETLPGAARTPTEGIVIAVWGPHGAPGRTTVAISVAAHLARRCPGEVLLMDADPRGGTVGAYLGMLEEGSGLPTACRKSRAGQLDLVELAQLSPAVGPFRYLPGLADAERWHLLSPAALPDVLTVARAAARYTVVDVGFGLSEEPAGLGGTPGRDAVTLACIRAADHIIAVGACDTIGIIRLSTQVPHLLTRTKVTPAEITTVLNKVRPSSVGTRSIKAVMSTLDKQLPGAPVATLPWDHVACDRALLGGRTLVEAAPGAALTHALGVLAVSAARAAGKPVPTAGSGAADHPKDRRLRRALRHP